MNLPLFALGLLIGAAIVGFSLLVGLGLSAIADRVDRKDPRP